MKKNADKIIITFLDGSNYEIPLTNENEKKLLNIMIKQATDRSESSAYANAKSARKKTLLFAIYQVGFTVWLYVLFRYTNNSNKTKIFWNILCGITGLSIVMNGLNYKFKNDEIKELEKYEIYLSIRSRLENIKNDNLYNGVEKHKKPLDINSLDSYSLNDLKRIRANLSKCEKYEMLLTKKNTKF